MGVQSELPHELAQCKTFMAGTSKQGQPCMFVKGARHDATERDVEQCKRCICYTLDRASEQARFTPWTPSHHLSTHCHVQIGLEVVNKNQ